MTREAHAPVPFESVATQRALRAAERHSANNYYPLPVVLRDGDGSWVTDVEGRRYLDCLAGYGALNFGHRHPDLVAAAVDQLSRLTLTSRAFHHDQFGAFCRSLAQLAGMDLVLPMNTGVEAVESALKIARKWGYEVKGVPRDRATILVASGNFHGRTISVVGFSDDDTAREGFGPFVPGFRRVPFGVDTALTEAIDDNTVAFLVEPVQGEAGVQIPPDGYLREVRRICSNSNVLLIADEIQSGLGRTGTTFACDHEEVVPDMYVLGKALGGGIVPLSAVVASADVLAVLGPGQHGSTFGGNPLACAVGSRVVRLLMTGEYQDRSRTLGSHLSKLLAPLVGNGVNAVRARGLWAGVDIDPALMSGREACERLLARQVLAKETHGATVRLSPPLVIDERELEFAVEQLATVIGDGTSATGGHD